jgi:hypothetical protein
MIEAPCVECVRLWLSRQAVVFEARESDESDRVVFKDGPRVWRYPFFPHPQCLAHPPFAAREKAFLLEEGPTSFIRGCCIDSDGPGPIIAAAWMDPPVGARSTESLIGRGIDANADWAMFKAVMESLERFCTFCPPRARVDWAAPEQLHGQKVSLPEVAPQGVPRWWLDCTQLSSGEVFKIPLEYVQHAWECQVANPLVRADSSGMAIHGSREAAISNGLNEALERAGLRELWQGGVNSRWRLSSLPEKAQRLAALIGGDDVEIFLCPVSVTERVAAVACFAVGRENSTGRVGLVCGAGAAENLEEALTHALTEAYAQFMHALEIDSPGIDLPLHNSYDHFLYYVRGRRGRRMLEALGVFSASELGFPTLPARSSKPFDAYWVDRGNTLTDWLSLSAVHVIAPSRPPLRRTDTGKASPWPTPFA